MRQIMSYRRDILRIATEDRQEQMYFVRSLYCGMPEKSKKLQRTIV